LKLLIPEPTATDRDRHFQTEHLRDRLDVRSVQATALTLANQGAGFVLRLVSGVILARLLTPEDFGLVGMVTIVVSFVVPFSDFGLSLATVQKESVSHVEASALFWFNVAASALLALVIIAGSPLIAWWYGEPRVIPIAIVLSSCLMFAGLRTQHNALLRRHLRFGVVAIVDFGSTVVGIVAAISVAWVYSTYWALVTMYVVTGATLTLGFWLASAWRPGWPVGLRKVKGQLVFGSQCTGSQMALLVSRSLDNVLIGRWWGAAQLGLYARAYQLMLLPLLQITQPIGNVAIRTLSILQSDRERFQRYYCKALSAIAFAAAPLTVTAATLSDEIILLLLGPKWEGTSQLFKILAIVGLLEPIGATTGWILIATGRSDKLFRWGLLQAFLVVGSFFCGLPWGAIGVASAFAVCKSLVLVPSFWYTLKDSPVSARAVIGAVWRPACLSVLLFAVLAGAHYGLADWSNTARLLAAGFAGFLVYATALLAWPEARAEACVLLTILRLLKRRPGLAPATASSATDSL
jgi:PST family polysaccharide transporter